MRAKTVVAAVCLAVALGYGTTALAETGTSAARNIQGMATLQSLDGGLEAVQFRPAEITTEKSVPWKKHKSSKGDTQVLEFYNAEPMTLRVEMIFDEHVSRENVHDAYIAKLEAFMRVLNDDQKRPPLCLLTWNGGPPGFKGVVESLSVKYTRFLSDGTPVRAEATLEMKQASKVRTRERKKKKPTGAAPDPTRTTPSGAKPGSGR